MTPEQRRQVILATVAEQKKNLSRYEVDPWAEEAESRPITKVRRAAWALKPLKSNRPFRG